jgi:dTDP-glucose 4,6-dehydratase
MRHIITGGSGFTGMHLISALANSGGEIVVFDRMPPAAVKSGTCRFVEGDVRDRRDLSKLALRPGDIVHHLAARQFHLAVPNRDPDLWFSDVNVGGTEAVLETMTAGGADRIVFLSTDMVYGRPQSTPLATTHPLEPLGPYGRSKLRAENALARWRATGGRATVFRPRMICGPGRVGILGRLFALIDRGLPVPMIGSGRNHYQMIAVQDCVNAMIAAVAAGCPAGPFNLGSSDPPEVRVLLRRLISHAGSRSIPVATPARAVKLVLAALNRIGTPLLHPEQYLIADADYVLDTTVTNAILEWSPTHTDDDMLISSYNTYRLSRAAGDDS